MNSQREADNPVEDGDCQQVMALLIHDLENPLAVVKNFMDRVAEGRYDAAHPLHQRLFESARLALTCAEQILADALDHVRYAHTGLQLKPMPVHVHAFLEQCIVMLTPLADEGQLQLELTVAPELPEHLAYDPDLIRRVVDNFLANALRHTAPGGTVHLAASQAGERLRIEVSNPSPEPVDWSQLDPFDPHQQALLRQQRHQRGIGLGLTFSRMIILAHDGRIGVTGRDHLTVFWFEIPLFRQSEA